MVGETLKTRMLPATIRITGQVREQMDALLFSRYPRKEWATFFVFGLRETAKGAVVSIVDIVAPQPGDLNPNIGIVEFREPYSLRAAMFLRSSMLFIGVIHSHPQGVAVQPSSLDDDMDSYYREYFSGFASAPAYFSLIVAKDRRGNFSFSGRGWTTNESYTVQEFVTVAPGR